MDGVLFDYKDLGYLLVYAITFVGTFSAFKYRISRVEDLVGTIKKTVFKSRGGLNVIDYSTCKEHRATFNKKLEEEAKLTKECAKDIQYMNQNIVKIMVHMKIEPITSETKNE